MFKGGVWILLGRWEGNFTRWDWRGGEGVWILRANVPAGWLRIESVEIWREVTARYFLSCKDSNCLEKSWARKVKEPKGKWNWFVLSESTCFCINPFLKWCFCIPEKDLLCRQTDIRHRLRALWGGADRKAFSGDFFFYLPHPASILISTGLLFWWLSKSRDSRFLFRIGKEPFHVWKTTMAIFLQQIATIRAFPFIFLPFALTQVCCITTF